MPIYTICKFTRFARLVKIGLTFQLQNVQHYPFRSHFGYNEKHKQIHLERRSHFIENK